MGLGPIFKRHPSITMYPNSDAATAADAATDANEAARCGYTLTP